MLYLCPFYCANTSGMMRKLTWQFNFCRQVSWGIERAGQGRAELLPQLLPSFHQEIQASGAHGNTDRKFGAKVRDYNGRSDSSCLNPVERACRLAGCAERGGRTGALCCRRGLPGQPWVWASGPPPQPAGSSRYFPLDTDAATNLVSPWKR